MADDDDNEITRIVRRPGPASLPANLVRPANAAPPPPLPRAVVNEAPPLTPSPKALAAAEARFADDAPRVAPPIPSDRHGSDRSGVDRPKPPIMTPPRAPLPPNVQPPSVQSPMAQPAAPQSPVVQSPLPPPPITPSVLPPMAESGVFDPTSTVVHPGTILSAEPKKSANFGVANPAPAEAAVAASPPIAPPPAQVNRMPAATNPWADLELPSDEAQREKTPVPDANVKEMTVIEPLAATPATPSVSASSRPAAAEIDPVVGWLVVVKGPGRGSAREIVTGRNAMGSAPGQAIRLDFGDPAIAPHGHAYIVYDDEAREFVVEDGKQKIVVRLNGKLLTETMPIGSGDELRIGATTLRFIALCGPDFDWDAEDDTASKEPASRAAGADVAVVASGN